MPTLLARFRRLPIPSPAEALVLRTGTLRDYQSLSRFHYLADPPAVATRVLVLEEGRKSKVAGRRSARTDFRPEIVAILVETAPALSCALRDVATGGRYRNHGRRGGAMLLNAEVRCISRVVVDPCWRGLGLAVRLVRHALDTATTPYTEAIAAMGAVHPFFALAGMTAYHRPALMKDQRLIDALRCAGIEAWELACVTRVMRRLTTAHPQAATARRELARWARGAESLEAQLELVGRHLLRNPVYYLYRRPSP